MKKQLFRATFFALSLIGCLTPNPNLIAQDYFTLTDISISPDNPTNYDFVQLTLSGWKSDDCSYLDFFDSYLYSYGLHIEMDWQNSGTPPCSGTGMLWDTTLNLEVLPNGTYTISLTGTHFDNQAGSLPSFIVTEGVAGTCGANGIIWVTNKTDDGPGSLRSAINCANAAPGSTIIVFDIPGVGEHTLKVGTTTGLPLPAITQENVFIDATTQPGWGTDGPRINLSGAFTQWVEPVSGLHLQGDDCSVYGLDISGFPDNGILVDGVLSCQIGNTDKANNIHNNGFTSISSLPANYNSGVGIRLINGATYCFVQSNFIGTPFPELTPFANEFAGVLIHEGCHHNFIGGFDLSGQNTIAHHPHALRIEGNAWANQFLLNQFSCNEPFAIELVNGANNGQQAPIITAAFYQVVRGTASANNSIDIYIIDQPCTDAPCQGKTLLGTAIADANGEWTLTTPFAHGDTLTGTEMLTAIATDPAGNSSSFSNCKIVGGTSPCTSPEGAIRVTNTNDEGDGSLRQAIICANETPGANQIHFDIDGPGQQVIPIGVTTGSDLPDLTDWATTIDATTQPGFGDGTDYSPKIVLDGSQHDWNTSVDALRIRDDYIEIYGLEITGFPDDGISIRNAHHITIGNAGKGNVIYNNGFTEGGPPSDPQGNPHQGSAIVVENNSGQIHIFGNTLGTNYEQTDLSGNEFAGIEIGSNTHLVQIGGTGLGNVIAHNEKGVYLDNNTTSILISQNNFFCNDSIGIRLVGTANDEQVAPIWNGANLNSPQSLSGQAAPDNAYVEVFKVEGDACPDAPCQGTTFLGSAPVVDGQWTLDAPYANGATLDNGEWVTATAIDVDGNTSEFSECQLVVECMLEATAVAINHATCHLPNGSFIVVPTGGPPPFSFDMGSGPLPIGVFADLPAGEYTVTISDDYSCTTAITVEISDPGLPVASISDQGDEACGMQNGFITLQPASGGTAPYSYDIGNGPQPGDPHFANLATGNYVVTVIDASGCTDTESATIDFIAGPEISISDVEDAICGQTNGTITVTCGAGTSPYQFNIGNGPQSSGQFIGLSGGEYVVVVIDANGCTDETEVTIGDVPGPSISISSTSDAICGQSNGTITATCGAGTSPYHFDIGNGPQSSGQFTGLPAGEYTVVVIDANGCTDQVEVSLSDIPGPEIAIISQVDAICGQPNGALAVNGSSGTPPYTYDIGNGPQLTGVFNNLPFGEYTVVITDTNGCSAEVSASIGNVPGPEIAIISQVDAICGQPNGALAVNGSSGTPPYTYDIGNGPQLTGVFNNLPFGEYTVVITDTNGCSAEVSASIGNIPGPEIAVISQVDATCDQSNGALAVNGSSGTLPYTYDIGNGPQLTGVFNNLPFGEYTVVITDTNGCSAEVSISIGNIPGPEASIASQTDASCGQSNGTLTVNGSNGTPPYTYDIGSGPQNSGQFTDLPTGGYNIVITDANGCTSTVVAIVGSIPGPEGFIASQTDASCGQSNGSLTVNGSNGTPPYTYDIGSGPQNSGQFTGLPAGGYNIVITDANGCTSTVVAIVGSIPGPEGFIASQTDASCGQSNGSLTVNGSNGTPPYTYDIGLGPQNSGQFTDLSAGGYNIVITDANGCTSTTVAIIGNIPGPEGSIASQTDASCGQPNGTLTVNGSNGTPPYTYDIGSGPQNSGQFTDLPAGGYNIVITDANGCTSTAVAIIGNIPGPEVSIASQTDASCGQPNGSLTVNGSNGTQPYTYDIGSGPQSSGQFTDLPSGGYNIVITDANGCTSTAVAIVGDQPGPEASIASQTDATCGQPNGSLMVNGSSGTPPYTYDIGLGPQNSGQFTDLSAGGYNIVITDADGCTAQVVTTVSNVNGPTAVITSASDAVCGQSNGALTASGSGGTAPYTYDIGSGPQNNGQFTGLPTGGYIVVVTDANDCSFSIAGTVGEVDGPTAMIASQTDAACGQSNGTLTVSGSGGTAPYNYDIGSGTQINGLFVDLPTGGYIIVVTDANGCTDAIAATVGSVDGPIVTVSYLENASCDEGNGVVTVLATGGTEPYVYDIGNGAVSDPEFDDLNAGSYTVTVTDATGCSSVVATDIESIGQLSEADFTFSESTGLVDFSNISQDGETFSWDFGDGSGSAEEHPTHSYAANGDYTVCLTVSNDCGEDQVCQTISIVVTVSVSGIIIKENGVGVDSVWLYANGQAPLMNNVGGTYAFPLIPANNSTAVVPEKDINIRNGVSTYDVFLIQQHVLLVDTLDSPYKMIAADANRSGFISTWDVSLVQKVVLFVADSFPNNTSWRFVPADYVFPDPMNPFSSTFPEMLTINTLTSDMTDEYIIAIKIGDINLNADSSMLVDPSPDDWVIGLADVELVPGELVEVAFTAKEAEELAALQMDVVFDTGALSLEGVTPGVVGAAGAGDFNLRQADNGLISLAWYDRKGVGQRSDVGEVLFSLQFTALERGWLREVLDVVPARLGNVAFRPGGEEMDVELVFSERETNKVDELEYKVMVRPNPFSDFVDVLLESPGSGTATLKLFDVTGRLLWSKTVEVDSGRQSLPVRAVDFPARGMYFLEIGVGEETKILRLVKE